MESETKWKSGYLLLASAWDERLGTPAFSKDVLEAIVREAEYPFTPLFFDSLSDLFPKMVDTVNGLPEFLHYLLDKPVKLSASQWLLVSFQNPRQLANKVYKALEGRVHIMWQESMTLAPGESKDISIKSENFLAATLAQPMPDSLEVFNGKLRPFAAFHQLHKESHPKQTTWAIAQHLMVHKYYWTPFNGVYTMRNKSNTEAVETKFWVFKLGEGRHTSMKVMKKHFHWPSESHPLAVWYTQRTPGFFDAIPRRDYDAVTPPLSTHLWRRLMEDAKKTPFEGNNIIIDFWLKRIEEGKAKDGGYESDSDEPLITFMDDYSLPATCCYKSWRN